MCGERQGKGFARSACAWTHADRGDQVWIKEVNESEPLYDDLIHDQDKDWLFVGMALKASCNKS